MASSGKKSKKTKGKTFALNYFLQETPGSTPTIPIRKSNTNWADEVEDIYDQYESGRPKANVVLPTAPKSARGFDEFSEKIPQHPPYNAYITNLPYDVQEEEISEFFGDLKIAHMRIPREERPGELPRLKGFGYVEFEDRESLIGALSITDCTLKNRRIRIEVADNSDNDRKRGGRMDNNRDRGERSDITSGDWRSRPRVEPSEPERSRPPLFSRDRDNTVNERDRGGSWRDSSDRSNLNNLRDGDRNLRDSDRNFRDGDRNLRDGDRNRFNDGEKRGFGSRRGDRDDKDSFSRGNRDEPAEPKTRPKLVLARRTIPLPTEGEQTQPETVTNPVPASNSIFGKAKPVDTSIKERQIEEWLAKQSESSANDRDNRRDRGRRDDDSRWSRDKRKDMPRRDSPIRRSSPEQRNNYSPPRSRDFDRRNESLDRKYSPDRRKRSPDYRRNSRDRRRSPDRSPRRKSPEYRGSSPNYRRNSPSYKRGSPDHRRSSPDYRRSSPDDKRSSPDYRRNSPEYKRDPSPDNEGDSYNHRRSLDRKKSPEHKKGSPPRRKDSPDHKKKSPDRSQPARLNLRKTDDRDKKTSGKSDKPQKNDKDKNKKEEKSHRENHEKEMPKLREPETPNFAAYNKYSFLDGEENLD